MQQPLIGSIFLAVALMAVGSPLNTSADPPNDNQDRGMEQRENEVDAGVRSRIGRKDLATSPDGNVQIFAVPEGTILSEGLEQADERKATGLEIFLIDKRNRPRLMQDLNLDQAPSSKVSVRWGDDSTYFSILFGEEKVWTEKFLVLRRDGRTGVWLFEEPRLPNLIREIQSWTNEKPAALVPPEPIEVGDEQWLTVSNGWVAGLPSSVEIGVEIQFDVDLYLSNGNGGRLEKWHAYRFRYATPDWSRFKLLRIVRLDPAVGGDSEKSVTLFEK
ncbi:MAG: hypothetical protein R3F11_00730 [Verrucomicrobiales bacterium]